METYTPPKYEQDLGYQVFVDGEVLINRQLIEAEAWQLLEGRDTQLQPVPVQENLDNARTALMEALTASGHLSRVEISGSLEEINSQVLNRLLNGWDSNLPAHEQKRRFAELCNELFIQVVLKAVAEGHLPADTEILEISDYPEALIGTSIGYRHANKKGMVRSTGLMFHPDGSYTRVIEQTSRSNGTWHSTFGFFDACNIQTTNKATDLAALEKPVIYSASNLVDKVVDVMRLLDEHTGQGVKYGDSGERAANSIPYEDLRQESARREAEIATYYEDLAKLEIQLDSWLSEGLITQKEKTDLYNGEVVRILNAVCTLAPEYAADTFGSNSAPVFHKAAELTAMGRVQEAAVLLNSSQYLMEKVVFCGATIEIEDAKKIGLEVNSFGSLVEKGKNSWKWKDGVCVVKACPSRPTKTKVGPCSVCKSCQAKFDAGQDPTKNKAA